VAATTYLLLVLVAIVPVFLPGAGALAGVGAVVLTLPWSPPAESLVKTLSPALLEHQLGFALTVLASAIPNAVLLYLAVAGARARAERSSRGLGPGGR
jgi:hypothetical protein